MSKLKIAIIGCGGISECHIDGYLRMKDRCELYAFCDINPDRLAYMGEKYGIPEDKRFLDKDEMLAALPEIDIVSVTTWNSAHAECAIAALNAGKDVICEKPMAMNEAEALAMKKAADDNGRLLMIGFVRRHGRDAKTILDFNKEDFFGEIYYAKATYIRRNGAPGGWFGDKSRSGGGPVIDLGVHVIDLCKYLMGNHKPVSVYAATFEKLGARKDLQGNKDWESVSAGNDDIFDVEDFATALIRFDNGSVINLETSFTLNTAEPRSEIELFGEKAGAKLSGKTKLVSDIAGQLVNIDFEKDRSFDFTNAFRAEIKNFVDSVSDHSLCVATAQDGVELMHIIDGIYKSAASGHEVLL